MLGELLIFQIIMLMIFSPIPLINCTKQLLIRFQLNNDEFLDFNEQHLFLRYGQLCALQIAPVDGDLWLFGSPTFRAYCQLFDWKRKRIGFSKLTIWDFLCNNKFIKLINKYLLSTTITTIDKIAYFHRDVVLNIQTIWANILGLLNLHRQCLLKNRPINKQLNKILKFIYLTCLFAKILDNFVHIDWRKTWLLGDGMPSISIQFSLKPKI